MTSSSFDGVLITDKNCDNLTFSSVLSSVVSLCLTVLKREQNGSDTENMAAKKYMTTARE